MAVNPAHVADVVFSGDSATGTWSELATDDSGEDTNLTAGTDSAYETSSARANLTRTRTVDILIQHDNTVSSSTLWTWDRASTLDRININSGDTITVFVNGSLVITHTISSVSGTAQDYVISWAMEPNIDSTGTADARRSELHVYNQDADVYEFSEATHPAPTAGVGSLIFCAQDTSDTGAYAGTTTGVRLSSAFHTWSETYETFVSQSSAPTLIGNEYRPFELPQRSDVSVGDDGAMSGPVLMMGAKACEQHSMLASGPVVNAVNNSGAFIVGNQVDGKRVGYPVNSWDSSITDSRAWRLEHLFWRPIPVGTTHVVPYVHIQSDEGASSDDLVLYVYSMNRPGPLSSPPSSSGNFVPYFVSTTIATDHGDGIDAGVWVRLDKLKISYDRIGWSYFCVALDIDTAAGSQARVNSICLDPIVSDEGDGLGLGGITVG